LEKATNLSGSAFQLLVNVVSGQVVGYLDWTTGLLGPKNQMATLLDNNIKMMTCLSGFCLDIKDMEKQQKLVHNNINFKNFSLRLKKNNFLTTFC